MLFVFLTLGSFAQTDYYRGYSNGFRYGCQCYDYPTKNVLYHSGTYDKGYDDGKLDGVLHSQRKMNNVNTQNSGYRYNTNDLYVPDFDLVYQALNARQNAHLSNQSRIDALAQQRDDVFNSLIKLTCAEAAKRTGRFTIASREHYRKLWKIEYWTLDYSNTNNYAYVANIFENYINEIRRIIYEIHEERRSTIKKINDTRMFYKNVSNYPQNVPNGWHNVLVTNNLDILFTQKVYVEQGRILKFCYDDWSLFEIEHNQPIVNCRSFIKLKGKDDFFELYFLDLISQKGPIAFSPLTPGSVAFWTNINFDESDNIEVIVEGIWIGMISKTLYGSNLECGMDGMLVYQNKPGTYKYRAISDKYDWEGTITITENQCKKMQLSGK